MAETKEHYALRQRTVPTVLRETDALIVAEWTVPDSFFIMDGAARLADYLIQAAMKLSTATFTVMDVHPVIHSGGFTVRVLWAVSNPYGQSSTQLRVAVRGMMNSVQIPSDLCYCRIRTAAITSLLPASQCVMSIQLTDGPLCKESCVGMFRGNYGSVTKSVEARHAFRAWLHRHCDAKDTSIVSVTLDKVWNFGGNWS